MRTQGLLAMVGTAGLVGTSAAAADPIVPLAPVSKWQMDYAPAECRLLRTFGEGKDKVTLQLSRLDVEDALELSLAAERMPATDNYVPASVSTSTVEKVPKMYARGAAATRETPGIIRFGGDMGLVAALRADTVANQPTRLSVNLPHRYRVQLDLGPMKGPIAALDTCMNDLITSWGLDPNEQRQRKSAPVPTSAPMTWFRPDDYPSDLSRRGSDGTVVVRLVIAADGSIKTCSVAKSGGDKAFEDLSCRLAMARARFRPAVGASGQPITSSWIVRIFWLASAPRF
jgi:TonB family protein